MAGEIEGRLNERNIVLPQPAAPAGAYVPYVIASGFVFVSGQLPIWNGELRYCGRLGAALSIEDGYAAARLCGLNLIAQLCKACAGDLDRVRRVVRLGGFVHAGEGFTEHPKVLNGASDLMVEVFGERGRHARFAVGAPHLPLDVACEIEGVFLIG